MAFSSRTSKALTISVATAAALVLAACGSANNNGGGGGGGGSSITIGTTDRVIALDPAGSYDFGSQFYENNIYQYLLQVPAGQKTLQPDAAQSCSFTKPTVYTCKIKSGQKFSNGDTLTADDVAFSFTRILKINDPNGPASLLTGMSSVKADDPSTVSFTLKKANDQTFPFILTTAAGPIVDSKVFPADKLLPDSQVVGSGPYKVDDYNQNTLVQLSKNPNYGGPNIAKTDTIIVKYETTSSALKLDIQSGQVDIAYRSLAPTDIDSLRNASDVKVLEGAGGEIRYIVFDLKTMPGNNDAQKLAIRQAMAYSVDRAKIAEKVYRNTYQPLYSMVPQGFAFATQPFKDVYGTTPNPDKAKSILQAAGLQTPVSLHIQYVSDTHYGPSSDLEYNEIKRQLEATGLFKVTIQGTEYTTYSAERVKDTYPIFQLGWFPDYLDADDFLSPFLVENNFPQAHYCDVGATNRPCDKDGLQPLLNKEETSKDPTVRQQAFTAIQQKLATGELPYLPLLQGKQVAVVRSNISGVAETLDPTYIFRMWLISKS
jgi:peptide/nickel transport system substrate-binding protein